MHKTLPLRVIFWSGCDGLDPFKSRGIRMMLMPSVLAWVPVCRAASACMSACSVWGWPLEPDLLAASG